ncbi:MAG: L-serine ammonia-lyase, iron-sulfur-dependent subunit beta [Clostridia bacterium]|nr:L-serine ammonia-lyase, iron-sulfur-dependent subunit beta [Clostridia bacterium]MBR6007005.1 L-serine ammonia-lyase, iron-sulfur-dependent subunit beta [Clostridia bacterium]
MKEFSVFDIIGPRMVGPSSSHTAGAVRIGLIAHRLIGGEHIARADITLYGSFAETGFGHGTDRAILAGILGIQPDDARVRYSVLLAQSEGVEFSVTKSDYEMNHPNTARIRVVSESGREFTIVGASIGGGNIEIVEINGMEVSFSGDYPAIILFYKDVPGVISKVTAILAAENINVAFMKVFRSAKLMDACMVIESDAPVPEETIHSIKEQVSGIKEICAV